MMNRRVLQLITLLFLSFTGVHAQTLCTDLNGYVSYKNTADTGFYTLNAGYEEKAAQTYHYSGPGRVSSVRVYGNYPGIIGGVPLRVGIYNVDNTGRPTSLIQATNTTWWWFDNFTGYITVNFGGGGVVIDQDFAVEVELRTASPWGNSFRLQYTGNGEGHGENLASLAGSSTGGNWSSAMTEFNRDGDFYLVPRMTHYITSDFSINSACISAGGTVNFTNSSVFSKDSMFNKIAMPGSEGNYYNWDFGDGSAISHATSPSHTYTTPGVYTVTLTSNLEGWNNSCTDVKTMQVSVGLEATATSVVNVACHGGSDGAFMGGATGGASPYTYSINDETFNSNPLFTGLGAGSYTLQVVDHIGCTASTSVSISQPAALTFTTVQSTTSTCSNADGGILVAATGGTGALLYKLNSGAYQASGSFPNKASGTYTVTVKDARDCTASVLVSVSDAGGPTLSILSSTSVSCNGGSDGSIVLNGTGGAGVLQYSINGGTTYQTSGSFLNIPAGNYAAIVKDANGCSKSTIINITQPQALSISATTLPVQCFGGHTGQVVVTAAGGGTGSFTYSINGTVYQSGQVFAGLAAGTYVVRVKDVAGCTANDTVEVRQPVMLTATATTTAVTCHGGYNGTVTISATGGTGNYSYRILGGRLQTSPVFTELSAGTYSIAVFDENSCVYNVTATVTEPTPVDATINVTASTCGNSNGGFLAIGSGGTGNGY
ncbi:MAG TPA: PKD domain-containing protein, partial [Chitinophagales bacterium]|nr:PKD domain-containing protein [Chitinophagales bacterium]